MFRKSKRVNINRFGRTFFLVLATNFVFGQNEPFMKEDSVERDIKKWYGHPVVGSGPETGLLLGAGLFYNTKEADSTTRVSFISGSLSVTLKGYWTFNASKRYFTAGERYLIEGDIGHASFPLYFYGTGNAVKRDTRELYFSKNFRAQFIIYKALTKGLFWGAGYRYGSIYDVNIQENGMLDSLHLTGSRGHYFSGPQLGVVYDSRDNPLAATGGWFVKLNSGIFLKSFGSRSRFYVHSLDIRRYFQPVRNKEDVLAIHVYGMSTSGDVPFTELALMGNQSIMRGYYSGQYRDKNLMAGQVEYRYHANDWFGLVGFVGIGAVTPSHFQIRGKMKPSYGGGVRFVLPPSDHLTLRIDYGWGINSGNLYVGLMEAF